MLISFEPDNLALVRAMIPPATTAPHMVVDIGNKSTDIAKSLKFFESRYQNAKLERMIMTGAASALPEFPLYLANKFGVEVEIGNSWNGVKYDPGRQNELLSVSNYFGVAVGLAERNE